MLPAAVVALISATFFAIGAVGQHHVASLAPTSGAGNPKIFLHLARSPMWWSASFGDLFGFVLQAVALGLGAVSVVQPLLVTGLLLAIPISAAIDHRKVSRAEILGALLCCAGLGAFLLAAQPAAGNVKVSGHDGLVLLATVGPIVTVLFLGTLRTSGVLRSVALALCAATLFGVCSPLLSDIVRDLHHPFGWPLATVAVCGITGFLLTQNAYQAGSLPAPLACLTITEPIVAVTLGVTLLHEHLDASPAAIAVVVASVAAVTAGVAVVAAHAPEAQRSASRAARTKAASGAT